MRNSVLLSILTLALSINCQSQNHKNALDTGMFNTWELVGEAAITNDGKYVGYSTQYGKAAPKTITIRSTFGNWIKEFGPGVLRYAFTDDSKKVLLQNTNDTLQLFELGTKRIIKTYNAHSFQQFFRNGVEWLLLSSNSNTLTLINFKKNKEQEFKDISSYYQDKAYNRLLLVKNSKQISWLDLSTMKETIIGEYIGVRNIVLDDAGNKIAFLMNKSIWYGDINTGRLQKIIDHESTTIDTSLFIGGINQFSHDGKHLLISLTEKNVKTDVDTTAVKVKIWNYDDSRLRTDPGNTIHPQSFLTSLDLESNNIIRIQQENEIANIINGSQNELILIQYLKGPEYEVHWNKLSNAKYFIYNCQSKERIKINFPASILTPDDKYVVGFDSIGVDVLAIDLSNGNQISLTKHLKRIPDQSRLALEDKKAWQFAGWFKDHFILLYDEYDIWKIDLSNPSSALCLTASLGKRKNLKFRFLNESFNKIYQNEELDLFNVFNNIDKKNGFYKQTSPNSTKDPIELIMSDALYSYTFKAKKAAVWVSCKQRVDSSPNYYITKDLITFEPFTNIYPEKNYNWPTAELINFITVDGMKSQAIVYKPGNFDPNKKYPLIINFYEKFSNELHYYTYPEAPYDNLSIPWFVNHDYIICKPDIIYKPMRSLEGALSSVEGVARYLAKMPYIDSTNIGLDGHSWGAFETNYIVSHSNYFKAAISSSGYANLISSVNSITLQGFNYFDFSTYMRHERIGKSMWERPDIYIRYSPIMDADKINTPLLLMANEKDALVNVEQGVQFFYALRRLGKPVWLLQYDNEGHSLFQQCNRIDWGLKMIQFFDHYLKNKKAPNWMIQKI